MNLISKNIWKSLKSIVLIAPILYITLYLIYATIQYIFQSYSFENYESAIIRWSQIIDTIKFILYFSLVLLFIFLIIKRNYSKASFVLILSILLIVLSSSAIYKCTMHTDWSSFWEMIHFY